MESERKIEMERKINREEYRITKELSEIVTNSVFAAGELAGVATKINADALELFLDGLKPDSDFRYTDLCRAAIRFAREAHK